MNDEDDDALVPTGFTHIVRKPDGDTLKPYSLEAMRGKKVIMRANGFSYRGVLVGADESEIYIRGEMRWIVMPLSTVTDVRLDDARVYPLGGWTPPDTVKIGDEDDS